jgi:membrane protease YdiL (CAAX protease family)
MNKIIAALITSILFALPHLFESSSGLLWVAGCDTFILSMVLVYVREKTDKLWASMLIHALKNFVAFASLYLLHNG